MTIQAIEHHQVQDSYLDLQTEIPVKVKITIAYPASWDDATKKQLRAHAARHLQDYEDVVAHVNAGAALIPEAFTGPRR